MSRILVTGGAGYIGSITARHLVGRGYDVVVVDDLSRGHRDNLDPARLRELSVRDTAGLTSLLEAEPCDAVIHFAAFIAVGESVQKPGMYFANNVGGTLSLLEAMSRAGVNKLVFSSTAAVYGNPERLPITEDQAFAPVSPYGESKAMVEKVLAWLDSSSGVRSVSLRYFNACGAEPDLGLGERHEPETHLIPLLIRAIGTGDPIKIFGDDYDTPDGTCIRDYIHVSDLAEAHVLALDHLLGGGPSDAFNAGAGAGHTVMEVLRAVEEVAWKKVPYEIAPRRPGDSASLVASSEKLRRVLGWQPRRSDLTRIVRDAWEFAQSTH